MTEIPDKKNLFFIFLRVTSRNFAVKKLKKER
jgi:hypothetical protein